MRCVNNKWMNKIKTIVVLFLCAHAILSNAQDIHFTQFYNAPLYFNPANTGVFNGRYRFSTNYKNQWQNVGTAYNSEFASFDISIPSKNLGVGISFLNDKAGKSQMGVTQGNLLLAYDLKINGSNHFVTGIQYGIGQRSIRTDNLKWDSQFNGNAYDPSLANGEVPYSNSYSYMDVSAGMMWNYNASHSKLRFKNSFGVALFHANQPRQSYNGTDKLYYKLVIHLNNQFKLAERSIYLLPQFLYTLQGPHQEINAGALFKFIIGEEGGDLIKSNRIDHRFSSAAAYVGGQLRFRDAFCVMGAFEFRRGLMLSTGYDINISKLNTASNFKGGAEISITYKGYF